MSKQEYNNQVITKYLLGALPADEAERFDELSVTDEKFANTLKSVENELVDSYVGGELAGGQLEAFESYYLASKMRREKVNFAQALQIFAEKETLKTKEDNFAIANAKPQETRAGFFSALSVFKLPSPLLQWGFAAAALVLIVLGGLLWNENIRLNQQSRDAQATRDALDQREQELQNQLARERSISSQIEQDLARLKTERERLEQELKAEKGRQQQQATVIAGQARLQKQSDPSSPPQISVAAFILMPPMRGNNSIQNLSIPAQTREVRMQLQLESDDYNSYRVALTDESGGANLWRSGTLKTKTKGDSKALNLRFAAKLLKSKIYSLVVSGVNSNGEAEIIGNYPFRSVIK